MEAEQLSPLAVTHLLQHTLRSLCIHENSQWVYAVFWRILPRNYPPPKWEGHGAYDRSRGNRRNWILVWEDGFCNFGASTTALEMNSGGDHHQCSGSGSGSGSGPGAANSSVYGNSSCDHHFQQYQGLQPELFFKMSHEIYNYGEGLIGKVAADHSHKWIYKEPNDQEINFLSAWHNSADSYPRTWEAQFQSGIKTIALIAVREGVVQLGSIHKVIEDLSYVVLLRKKFSYIESIPGVLLPHPSSSPVYPFKVVDNNNYGIAPDAWHFQGLLPQTHHHNNNNNDYYDHQYNNYGHNNNNDQPLMKNIITPSMSSLEALLSKLPSVVPPPPPVAAGAGQTGGCFSQFQRPTTTSTAAAMEFDHMGGMEKIAKDEIDEHDQEGEDSYRPEIRDNNNNLHAGESSSSMSMSGFRQQQHQLFHHSLARSTGPNNSGF